MLSEQQFQIVQGYKPLRFRTANLISRQPLYDIYEFQEKQMVVMTTNNLHLLSKIRALQNGRYTSPVLGYLRRGQTYYVFFENYQQQYTLKSYVQRIRDNIKIQPYLTFSEIDKLLKFMIESLDMLQGDSIPYLTILSPDMILVEESEPTLKFRYALPIRELIMSDRDLYKQIRSHYLKQMEFAAPEIIRYCMFEEEGKLYKRTDKQVLYSIGLVVLFAIFGECFPKDDRIKALNNKRDYESHIRFKRKTIKGFYNEKRISKTIKILLERNALIRDDTKSLKLKLASKQFLQLKAPQQPPLVIPQPEEYVPTIEELQHSNQGSQVKPDQIELNISKNLSSEIMKNSKQTEMSSAIYQKNPKPIEDSPQMQPIQHESIEFRVANSMEDIEDDPYGPFQESHQKTMNEKLVPNPPALYMQHTNQKQRVGYTKGNGPSENNLTNDNSHTNQLVMNSSQYGFRVEDEIRQFKYKSLVILLAAVAVATLLAIYYYLGEGIN